MSHFPVVVVLPADVDHTLEAVNAAVETLLAPYAEGDDGWFADGSRWDWWVVGGRWDGAIQGLDWIVYTEPCNLCDETGTRPDGLERFGKSWAAANKGCNGCQGTGQSTVWTTDPRYRNLERNIVQVKDLTFEVSTFVDPDGGWHEIERMGWFGSTMPDEDGQEADQKTGPFDQAWASTRDAYANNYAVMVDCHV